MLGIHLMQLWVIKRQIGYSKVRYRGLAKNTALVVTLFALSNLWMVCRHLRRQTVCQVKNSGCSMMYREKSA